MRIATLENNYHLKIKGEVYNAWDSVDENSQVDDAHEVDSAGELNAENNISTFFNFLFSVPIENQTVDVFRFDKRGNLLTPKIWKMIEALDSSEDINTEYQVDDLIELDTSQEISGFFNTFFGVSKETMQPNKFSVLVNKELILNEVLEKQTL